MKLETWAERQFREVEQDGSGTVKVRLVAADGGSTWEVWDQPFPSPQQFAEEAEALLQELAIEWPPKVVQVLFVAEGQDGSVRSQHPKSIRGKNKEAKAGLINGESKALSDAMEAQSRTMTRILDSANAQIDVLTKTVREQSETVHGLLEFVRESKMADALRDQEQKDVVADLIEKGSEVLPVLLEMIAARGGNNPVAGAAKAAAVAATKVAANGQPAAGNAALSTGEK